MRKQFSRAVFGYNKKEVDHYLEELKKDYEEELSKKRERMLELAEETRKMKQQTQGQNELIEQLTDKEKYVSRALIEAEQRAQAIVEEGRRKSAEEMEQLKSEKDRWRRKFREVRQELLTFEKNLLQIIEKFRDEINYHSAKEISDRILVDEENSEKINIRLNKKEGTEFPSIGQIEETNQKEEKKDIKKVIA